MMRAKMNLTRFTKLVGQFLLRLMWPRTTSLKAAMPNNQIRGLCEDDKNLDEIDGTYL